MSNHLQTQCPHCHSIFRLGVDTLAQADGQVRCGHCLAVFYAETSEVEPEENSITYETAFETAGKTADDTFAGTDQMQYDTAQATDEDDDYAVADVMPAELRGQAPRSGRGFFGKLFISLAVLLCLAAVALQYSWYNRAELVKINELRPWLEQACELAQCKLPQARDPSQFLLSSKNIFTHPNEKNALMVSATIINQADFAQAYPLIELRFANVRGQTIAARRFSAEEYLGIDAQHISQIPAHTPISFNLEIVDPGEEMISYEFEFL